MRLTISGKLRAGLFAILALMLAIGGVSVYKMTEMGDQAKEVNERWVPAIKLLGEIKANLIDIEQHSLLLVLETDSQQKSQIETHMNAVIEDLRKNQSEYEALITTDEERSIFQNLTETEKEMAQLTEKLTTAGKANDIQNANKVAKELKTYLDKALELVGQGIKLTESSSDTAMDNSVKLYETGKWFVNAMSVIAILLTIGITILLSRSIARPLVAMERTARKIANGDLTIEQINVPNKDEIGDLADSFNEMARNLRSLIAQVSESAKQVAASSEELTASSEQIASATEQIAHTMEKVAVGAEEQARSIEEGARSIDDMSAGVQHIASNAESVTEAAIEASAIAAEGNKTIQTTVEQMNAIHHTVDKLAEAVRGLGVRSQQIGQITEVITGIAGQTNLLALNAAIEAARVGEHGAGFAVVANEVRKLAEQSMKSAEQIAELIAAIQEETTQAVALMETGTEEVAAGAAAVNLAGQAFEQIQRSVHEVTIQIQHVSTATGQMSASTAQVVQSIHVIADAAEVAAEGTQHVSTIAEEQLASMEEITAAAASLTALSEGLQTAIGKFSV
ncbi:methyl-accepting chemotaxis protein [Brevibacillus fluminis]|uniref:methyl-accepting chemotaxis protein n=1 Tax=Brevibacillus fluminis TaxID=511487 RepID=UPI003F8BD0CE